MANPNRVIYPTLTLPSGKKIQFTSVTFLDRRKILKGYKQEQGYLMEELLAAYALYTIDGEPIDTSFGSPSIIERLDTWDYKDVTYYLEVFMRTVMLDDEMRSQAESDAKKISSGGTSTNQIGTDKDMSGTSPGLPKGLTVNRS